MPTFAHLLTPATQASALCAARAETPVRHLQSNATRCDYTSRFAHDFTHVPASSQIVPSIQRKLRINNRGDAYEQEADRIAREVTRMPMAERRTISLANADHQVQRSCGCGKSSGEGKHCAKCDEENRSIQRRHTDQVGSVLAPPIVNEVLSSPGEPMDAATRVFMEERFGADFAHVRIHHDELAGESTNAVSARAYTAGRHVVFAGGEYSPGTAEGRELLAHELTHVLQQGGASPSVPAPMIQRQEAAVHSSPPAKTLYEKWGVDVEAQYRRAGLVEAANAVKRCRESDCTKILTANEAYSAYRAGRLQAGMGESESTESTNLAKPNVPGPVLGFVGPGTAGGAAAAERAAAEALAKAGIRAAAGTGTVASTAGAGSATATAVTVAVPVALAAYVTVATVDLVSYGKFQIALQKQGYVLLPDILQVCISGCHQPAAPTFKPKFSFDDTSPLKPRAGPDISEEDRRKIEEWLKGGPAPEPGEKSKPKQDKRRDCLRENPNFLSCEDEIPIEEVVIEFITRQGYSYESLGECRSMGSVDKIEACAGAPGTSYHCIVKPYYNAVMKKQLPGGEVSVFGCMCCRADGTIGTEYRGEHWSPGPGK